MIMAAASTGALKLVTAVAIFAHVIIVTAVAILLVAGRTKLIVGASEEDEIPSKFCDFTSKVVGEEVFMDSRATRCVMVDSSNSNCDFAVPNIGKGSCC